MTVTGTLRLIDAMSGPLRNITQAMNIVISTMRQMQTATNQNANVDQQLEVARRRIAAAEAEITRQIEASNQAQNRLTQSTNRFGNAVVVANQGIQLMQQAWAGVKKVMDTIDTYTSSKARLELISGDNVGQLQSQVFEAADRARGDYSSMASAVGKLGILAGDAFKSNQEIVGFTELMQKSFKVGGSSMAEQQSAMYQLTQAMASGRLQGDEFRSIRENAPLLAQAIAKYTGKTAGELKEMSREGTISADIIKGAMFRAADDINTKFDKLPKTFSDVFSQIRNKATQTFAPVMERINMLLNSAGGEALINSILSGVTILANAVNWVIDAVTSLANAIAWIGTTISQTASSIEPFLYIIGGAFALWTLTQIPAMIAAISTLTTKLWLMVQPIAAAVVNFLILNWPILLIGALIGGLIYAMINFGDQTAQVIGFIGGIFGSLFAFLFNIFAYFANIVLSVAEFMANVFIDPVYAIKKLFYDLSINVLQFITNIAKGIQDILNMIPGMQVNITDGMSNLLNRLESARDSLKSDKDVVKLMRFEQMDYSTAFNKGQEYGTIAGKWAVDKVQGIAGTIGDKFSALMSADKTLTDGNIDVNNVASVGKINDTVDISSEDLRALRELAEMKNIQNFVTLTPTVTVQTGDIRNDADIDTIVSNIADRLETQIASSAAIAWNVG